MDFKKIISAALMPMVVLIVIGIISTILGFALATFIPLAGAIAAIILGLVIFAINCIILLWAGYNAARKYQLDVLGSALTGALAYVVAAVINSIISLVLTLAGVMPAATAAYNQLGTAATGAVMIVAWVIGLVIGIVVSIVIGGVLGAIGGFIGKKK
jgi:hypothetical protein